MIVTDNRGVFAVSAENYALRVSADAIIPVIDGVDIAVLDVRSPVCLTVDGEESEDTGDRVYSFELAVSEPTEAHFIWKGNSDHWDKLYRLDCFEDRFEYSLTVCGSGAVDSVNYFGGDFAAPLRGSAYDFAEGYYPIIPIDGTHHYCFTPTHDNYPLSYLSVPPMFCYSFRTEDVARRLALSLAAEPGEHNFTEFQYRTSTWKWQNHFYLRTDQAGHTVVDGEWTAPRIVGYAAESDHDALVRYRDYYFDHGICGRGIDEKKPRFWHGPIACGWLEQLAYHYATGDSGLVWASKQSVYEEYVRRLEARDLHPKILIIDDKWQTEYGVPYAAADRWDDLREFIDRMRAEKDIHTLMWYRMWDSEGVPEEFCTFDERENHRVVDPSNPGYQKILRENIHRIISADEGCYNADGLKIDFAFWQPMGRKAKTYSGKYGVELFLELVRLIHTYMKEEKPYAILNASPCHPLFAPYVDQVRLHDYDSKMRRSMEEFSERAWLWKCAIPYALVDTDGAGYERRRDTLRYLTRNRELGVPCIYAVSPTPHLALSDEDWAAVAAAWREYGEEVDKNY